MALTVTAAAAGLAAVPVAASAAGSAPASHAAGARAAKAAGAAPALPANERRACPLPKPGYAACQVIYGVAPAHRINGPRAGSPATVDGYGPGDLHSAYKMGSAPSRRGRGVTVAIVDAYRDPDAARNLATYRHHFHLSACTTGNHCLKIISQAGSTKRLPRPSANWALEESLDLDMVSAVCPRCHILLVEAKTDSLVNLGKAEDTAARHARFVSSSWNGRAGRFDNSLNHYFNHPGRVITFAAGDDGYGIAFPSDLQYVTAVGGTDLARSSGGRGWAETVWGEAASHVEGTGSGCSKGTAKPAWQRRAIDDGAHGCRGRTENDVAALADPDFNHGLAVYDSYRTGFGWVPGSAGGTSAATPLVTAMYALAGSPARRSYPASYLYQHSHFFDVTSGANGACGTYLCQARPGYDGPTGVGTPDGLSGLSRHGTDPVTIIDPGNKSVRAGHHVGIRIDALDTRSGAYLYWTRKNLPRGLHLRRLNRDDVEVTGTVSRHAKHGTYKVYVVAQDRKSHKSAALHFTIHVS